MKRNLWTSLMTVVAAGLVAFGVTRWQSASAAAPDRNQLKDAGWLMDRLDLTPEQVQRVEALQAEYGAALSQCCSRHCTARFELGEKFFSKDFPAERQKELVEQMCHAQAESDEATLKHIRAVHEVLTPAQQERYEQLVQQCLCADCSTCEDH